MRLRSTILTAAVLALAGCLSPVRNDTAHLADATPPVAIDTAGTPGELHVSPAQPRAGQTLAVTYRTTHPPLSEHARLHLRARLRGPEHEAYNERLGSRTVAVLERQPDGTWRGHFDLPDEVVHATFAVEDESARHSDTRAGRFWDVLVHGDDGRPLAEALRQRQHDHMGRDALEVLASARDLARLYPDLPDAWTTLRLAEQLAQPGRNMSERRTANLARLHTLDRTLSGHPELDAEVVNGMYQLARSLGESGISGRWRERLMHEHPAHLFALQERVIGMYQAHADDPAALLAKLETLWHLAAEPRAHHWLAGAGFNAAAQAGDDAARLTWANRLALANPNMGVYAMISLSQDEATRQAGIDGLEAMIEHWQQAPDQERPLGTTMRQYREQRTLETAQLRAELGHALLASGRTGDGIAQLQQATAVTWNTGNFRALGDALLAANDLEGAAQAFAAVAADPATPDETAQSLQQALGLASGPWQHAVATARAQMIERTLQQARNEALPAATLTERDGSTSQLEELVAGTITVIVNWSAHCGFSVDAMPQIAALAGQLESGGLQLLAITADAPAEAEPYLHEGGWPLHVLYDSNGEAGRALNSRGTPHYFVLDAAGRLRFQSGLEDLPRHTAALQAEQRVVGPPGWSPTGHR